MLSDLAIRNFAIIDDLRISFNDAFSVLTGETGAGKSIIIEAVNLLLGARASADLVRNGCDQAELEAFFDLDEDSDTGRILADQGMNASDGLIVRRVISANGKGRVFINSRQVTLDLLKQITKDIAGISSQHAHQGLLKEDNHLSILDEFADTTQIRAQVKTLYDQLVPLRNKIDQLKHQLLQNQKEQDFLQFQFDEIQEADIQPGEDVDLDKKRDALVNASRIFETVTRSIHEIHEKDGSMVENLAGLNQEMQRLSESDDRLEVVAERLSSILYDLEDAAHDLRDLSGSIDLDPASLEQVEQRLDLISKLKRKYGGSLESLFKEFDTLEDRLSQTSHIQDQIDEFEKQAAAHEIKIQKLSKNLSEKRKKAAVNLSKLAQKELEALEMGKARFAVDFSLTKASASDPVVTSDGSKVGPDGIDTIRFLLSPNPGEPLKPLVKIASGGELSRIVLALKAVLSTSKSLETLIFDEVDAGIGGATSERVGLKLQQLSEKHQVICITHLAQIAKYGTSQYRISKQIEKGRTFTTIIPLESMDSRIEEIARMIGGSKITHATLAHAKEMLEQSAP